MFRIKHQDTPEPTIRIFTPTRVVALALIAVLVAGLVYVRFAPGAGPITVPEGASAGELILEPCAYAAENGSDAADCGTLVTSQVEGTAAIEWCWPGDNSIYLQHQEGDQ